MSTPESKIYICGGVNLNSSYRHTIFFESDEAQLAYFSGKVVKTFSDYTYLRRTWDIEVQATPTESEGWNYLFFRNSPNGKYYFYFINHVEYVSDYSVKLSLEMDVMQTYRSDYILNECFIDREHSETDEVGDNLIDEGLELGEYVINHSQNLDMQDLSIVLLTTFDPNSVKGEDDYTIRLPAVQPKIYTALCLSARPLSEYLALTTDLNKWDGYGLSDGVVSMWMYPTKLLNLSKSEGQHYYTVNYGESFDTLFVRHGTLDGYIPTNKKLLTHPFNLLYVSNNSGGSAEYHYERFGDPLQCSLRVSGTPGAEGSVKLFPINYKGLTINYEEGLMGGTYPTCAWNQDVYKLWLAQNQNQQTMSFLTSAGSVLGGLGLIATGAGAPIGAGMMISGSVGVFNQIAQHKDRQVQPPQAKGSFSASINIENEHQTFTVQKKSIDGYHARIIDDFFTMYGYKTNRVKIPNRKVRKHFTYTKTVGCQVAGNLCNEDKVKIQNIFDNGVTFWVDGDEIGWYITHSTDNTPL